MMCFMWETHPYSVPLSKYMSTNSLRLQFIQNRLTKLFDRALHILFRRLYLYIGGGEMQDGTILIQGEPVNRVTSLARLCKGMEEWFRK